jgi:DNA-directed RNA polymerase specialized sigma subunit
VGVTSDPDALVTAAIEQALAIDNPALRARTITRIIKAIEDDPRPKEARAVDVRELRKDRTLKEVAELVELSIGRVDQIAKGTITGRRAKAAEKTGP